LHDDESYPIFKIERDYKYYPRAQERVAITAVVVERREGKRV
jgi:hypothetical protein